MTDEPNAKRPVGRPTKYDPEFCEKLVSLMSEGLSFMASCGEIGVSKTTGQNWAEEHPEFLAAMTLGKARRARTALKNCNDEDFRDRKTVEQTITITRAEEMSDNDLATIAAGSGG